MMRLCPLPLSWYVDSMAIRVQAHVQLALTAASPAFRGFLADVDARWNVIAASVDDRTEEERGLKVSYTRILWKGLMIAIEE